MFKIGFSRGGGNGEVGGSDEAEKHDEPEERKCEEEIDAKGTDQEDEAGEHPAHSLKAAFPHTRAGTTHMETLWKP